MLIIKTPSIELFNERTNEFINIKPQELHLEHSLLSISKWESKWEKPFFNNGSEIKKTNTELTDYIRCMTINSNINPLIYSNIPKSIMDTIYEYMNAEHTATTIKSYEKNKGSSEGITSELIYYWMISYNIPFEAQKWHINRLLKLIEIFNVKSHPEKKMPLKEQLRQQRELNEARRKRLNTSG